MKTLDEAVHLVLSDPEIFDRYRSMFAGVMSVPGVAALLQPPMQEVSNLLNAAVSAQGLTHEKYVAIMEWINLDGRLALALIAVLLTGLAIGSEMEKQPLVRL